MNIAPEWISLNEACDRFLAAECGYGVDGDYWQQFTDKTLSEAQAVNMDSLLSEALAGGSIKAMGVCLDGSRDAAKGALIEIPSVYFRRTRAFRPSLGLIESWAREGTMEEFVETRKGGGRHPDWTDVVVARASLIVWLKGLKNGATQEKRRGPKPKIDKEKYYAEVVRYLEYRGIPDPTLDPEFRQSDVERHMMAWHGEAIGESHNRTLTSEGISIFKESRRGRPTID